MTPTGDSDRATDHRLEQRLHRRAIRARLGLTQQAAADRCGVSLPTYRAVENADADVLFSTIEKVAVGMGHSVADYVGPSPPVSVGVGSRESGS